MANSTPIGLQLQWHYWTLWDCFGKHMKRTANRLNWKRKKLIRTLKWRMPKELALRRRVWNRWCTWILLSMGDWALVLHWRLGCHLAAKGETCRVTRFEAHPIEIFSAWLKPRCTWSQREHHNQMGCNELDSGWLCCKFHRRIAVLWFSVTKLSTNIMVNNGGY